MAEREFEIAVIEEDPRWRILFGVGLKDYHVRVFPNVSQVASDLCQDVGLVMINDGLVKGDERALIEALENMPNRPSVVIYTPHYSQYVCKEWALGGTVAKIVPDDLVHLQQEVAAIFPI